MLAGKIYQKGCNPFFAPPTLIKRIVLHIFLEIVGLRQPTKNNLCKNHCYEAGTCIAYRKKYGDIGMQNLAEKSNSNKTPKNTTVFHDFMAWGFCLVAVVVCKKTYFLERILMENRN
jgi:hypothetical protein